MKQVLQWSGLTTAYVAPTWNGVVAALKRGHPVLLGNDLDGSRPYYGRYRLYIEQPS